MSSLVLELQKEAFLQDTAISVLMRKAYIVARKLGIREFVEWSEKELNGYKNKEDVPPYRVINGHLQAYNPYNGYIPAYFPKEIDDLLNKRTIFVPITEVEQYIIQGNENKGKMMLKFDSNTQLSLMKMANADFEVSLHLPVTQFVKIVDNVRNIILEWTLKLEEEGVLGEDMTFNDKEKEVANQIPSVTNIIGTMVNSQLQQNSDNSIQSLKSEEFKVENLKEIIEKGNMLLAELEESDTKSELQTDIIVLEAQLNSPKPKQSIIKESLSSVRNIAEGTTGSLVASGLIAAVKTTLGLL